MSKAERIIYILSLLRCHRFLRARDLAEKCDVSERTIYRDIISISGTNIPIYFQNGYRLLRQESLPPFSFTQSEVEFLLSVLSRRLTSGMATDSTAERIVEKIRVTQVLKGVACAN
jgi:predicted DNA-binding transcriptional regulator YafY